MSKKNLEDDTFIVENLEPRSSNAFLGWIKTRKGKIISISLAGALVIGSTAIASITGSQVAKINHSPLKLEGVNDEPDSKTGAPDHGKWNGGYEAPGSGYAVRVPNQPPPPPKPNSKSAPKHHKFPKPGTGPILHPKPKN